MKTKIIYQGIALLAVALTTAACQNELNEKSTEPKPGEKINMTIRATQGTGPQTRTDYEDKLGGSPFDGIVVKWEGGTAVNATVENIKVFGYDDGADVFTHSGDIASKPETLSEDKLSITFDGNVTVANNYLAIYPAENCEFDTNDAQSIYFSFLGQEQNCNAGQQMAHLKKCDIMAGQSVGDGTTNNFKFEHQATMLRFNLTLPTEESINKITLTNTNIDNTFYTGMYAMLAGTDIKFKGYDDVNSISLAIKNHTSSKTLKAYMMTAPCVLSNDLLTITVNTASGSTYTGILRTGSDTELIAGKCYTLSPTLTITPEINIPPLEGGKLGEALDKIISPDPAQTELALTGTVNDDDITSLASFLQDEKAKNITTLNLSGLTGITTVEGFAACTQIKNVVLPDNATAIGDNAFSGCTALTTVTQNETTAGINTRAGMPKRVKTVGKEAFKNCTAMTEMLLHSGITSVGNNAFEGCSSMTALVFEGTKAVGTEASNIKLGTDITKDTPKELQIFLPAIKDKATAATYRNHLFILTHYDFAAYSTADDVAKVDGESYTYHLNPGMTGEDGELVN